MDLIYVSPSHNHVILNAIVPGLSLALSKSGYTETHLFVISQKVETALVNSCELLSYPPIVLSSPLHINKTHR